MTTGWLIALFLALGGLGLGLGQLIGGRAGQVATVVGTVLFGVAAVLVLVES